jgi:N-acyl-D-aspartate/D-glutamate deacylase
VTSVALGNCGFGFAPSRAEDRDRAMLSMTRNEAIPYDAMKAGMPWNWITFPDFIESLIRTPKGVNCLTYVPLTPLYAWVMGWEEAKKRRPTEAELQEMCRLIHEAMDPARAAGLPRCWVRTRSSGITTGPRWSPICFPKTRSSPSPRYSQIGTKVSSSWLSGNR